MVCGGRREKRQCRASVRAVAAIRVVAVVVEVTGTGLRETAGEQVTDGHQGDEEPGLVGTEVVTDVVAVAGLACRAVGSDGHRRDEDADGDDDVEPELRRLPRRLRLGRDATVADRRAGGGVDTVRSVTGGGAADGIARPRASGWGCHEPLLCGRARAGSRPRLENVTTVCPGELPVRGNEATAMKTR